MKRQSSASAQRNAREQYFGYLGVAYLIALVSAPFIYRTGWIACLTMFFISGLIFGTSFYFLAMIGRRIRMRSFLLQMVVQSVLYTFNIALSSALVGICALSAFSGHTVLEAELYRLLGKEIQPAQAAILLPIGLALAFLINACFAISRKLGPGVALNWLTGKYYSPREELLVILFLDMKDSTSIAERLGALQFSALVRDFFSDLTGPLRATNARVSHYIGDEAVIYWSPAVGLKQGACIRLVADFRAVLSERRRYYEEKYGLAPDFKAGAHLGTVIATEVGDIKSEVVFHGDAVNTTARIQGLCNEEGESFLISGELATALKSTCPTLEAISLGSRALKGRVQATEVFAIRQEPLRD